MLADGVDELGGGLRRMDAIVDGTGLRGLTFGVAFKTVGGTIRGGRMASAARYGLWVPVLDEGANCLGGVVGLRCIHHRGRWPSA